MSTNHKHQQHAQTELDAHYLYSKIAELETNHIRKEIFSSLAKIEYKHFIVSLSDTGLSHEDFSPSLRAKSLVFVAKRFGIMTVFPSLFKIEKKYSTISPTTRVNTHLSVLKNIFHNSQKVEGKDILSSERAKHLFSGNNLRAAVLGANDGLISNLCLVMGVVGANPENASAIILVGVCGLFAGSFSMAIGEWLSVQNANEMFQHQMEIEEQELLNNPEEEILELALIYKAKGMSEAKAEETARKIVEDPQTAVETLVREELGFDPDEFGGSPYQAAFSSFINFCLGAIIPVLPFLFVDGFLALNLAIGLSGLALFLFGCFTGLITGNRVLYSGGRQLLLGGVSALISFFLGEYIGGIALKG